MSNLNNVERKLAEGTAGWLLFEFHCNRGNLFSEKNLVPAVGQILNGLMPGLVHAEVNHPYLIKSGRGRPCQLDYVVIDKGKWNAAIETKWCTETEVTMGQIVWDLIRLESLVYNKHCDGYFLIAGFQKRLNKILLNTHFVNAKQISATMVTSRGVRTITLDLKKLDNNSKNYINNKMKDFPKLDFPEIMRFTLPHSYPKDVINMTFKSYVWKVLTNPKSKRLKLL